MYYYKVYGLFVESEIEIPSAYRVPPVINSSVKIINGDIPEELPIQDNIPYQIGVKGMEYSWAYIDVLGKFFAEKGSKVYVSLNDTYDIGHWESYLLGPILSDVLTQKHIVALHGSAVEKNNQAIVVCGESGSGKSTITLELRNLGYHFMSDDIVAVTKGQEGYVVHAGYPQQKLCKDTVVKFGYSLEQLKILNEERQKYALPITEDFTEKALAITTVICLEVTSKKEITVEYVEGNEKLNYIINNLMDLGKFRKYGMNATIFKECVEVAKQVELIRVIRPENDCDSKMVVNKIIERLEGRKSLCLPSGV